MTIEGNLGKVKVGDCHPVRLMAVINLSEESFYKGSVATPEKLLSLAKSLVEEGADVIDLGAVSTAPGSPAIPEPVERDRLMPALRTLLENTDVEISVDTQRSGIADAALSAGAACVNDVSGLCDEDMARTVADHGGSVVIMASKERPGDILEMGEIVRSLGERIDVALDAGIDPEAISVDPGIGHWIPEKGHEIDLSILDGLRRLRVLGKPVMAALSRKSFIGAVLDQPDPTQRLPGSLSAAAIAVYNGAHILRTHDVAASKEVVRMAEAVRGRPPRAKREEIVVEVLGHYGHGTDLVHALRKVGVDPGGEGLLCSKGTFRALSVCGLSSMEALVIKQEMLARGGDAAVPRMALRCGPPPMEVLIFGTLAQIRGLINKLRRQPFQLPVVAEALEDALEKLEDQDRY